MDDLPPSTEAAAAPAQGQSAHAVSSHGHGTHDDHAHEHHELGFWRSYVFSTDHKTIGVQYLWGGLGFLFFGFGLMLLMRWQLAFPGQALSWANASNHIGYQFYQILYHLGLSGPPVELPAVPPDPNHPPLTQYIFGKDQMP